jgi:hypothetical protein
MSRAGRSSGAGCPDAVLRQPEGTRDPGVAWRALEVVGHPPERVVLVEVDRIVDVQSEAEPAVGQTHVGHERIGLVADPPLPLGTVGPGQPPVHEHAEAARMANGVVSLAEIRQIDVTQIVGVEHHLE